MSSQPVRRTRRGAVVPGDGHGAALSAPTPPITPDTARIEIRRHHALSVMRLRCRYRCTRRNGAPLARMCE
eukprot:scaffold63831_cov28-Tisochrysis_lutea.AAC.2